MSNTFSFFLEQSALCRAGVPQATKLIRRMAANSPLSTTALLKGCVDAAKGASNQVLQTVKDSIRALASLSKREATRVRVALQLSRIMVDLQLELALDQDPVAAACLLNRHLLDTRETTQKDNEEEQQQQTRLEPHKSLLQALNENETLARKTSLCLLTQLESTTLPLGLLSTYVRALANLLFVPRRLNPSDFPDVERVLSEHINASASKSACFSLILCCGLMYCVRLGENEDAGSSWHSLLKRLMTMEAPNAASVVLVGRFALSMKLNSLTDFVKPFCSLIRPSKGEPTLPPGASIADGFSKVCHWVLINVNLDIAVQKALETSCVVHDPSALLLSVESATVPNGELENTIKGILQSPDHCGRLIKSPLVARLLEACTQFRSKESQPALPLVSFIELEKLSVEQWSGNLSNQHSQFLLQFSCGIAFLKAEPTSPFVLDPRSFPCREIMGFVRSSTSPGVQAIAQLLTDGLSIYCPEALADSGGGKWNRSLVNNRRPGRRKELTKMLSSLVCAFLEDQKTDPSASSVEGAFLRAQKRLSTIHVDCEFVKALFSSKHTPTPYLTYTMLSRDPLVLLQCPISVWRCRGMRRVLLSVLHRLLDSNEALISEKSPQPETAMELLAARDLAIVRSLAFLASGSTGEPGNETTPGLSCSSLTSMVRSLVVRRSGLIAMLVKQGIPESVTDWLIDNVPECIRDAPFLTALLQERSSLAAAERLVAADAGVRIAVAHGSKDESAAKLLLLASLSQMVSSFFLVVGPVGVPVGILIEDNGADVTQLCRRSTLRMLDALQRVRRDRIGIRNECSKALQKLAGMCKGESLTMQESGAVGNRRKTLLKEIWDAIVKALNAMGSAVQL